MVDLTGIIKFRAVYTVKYSENANFFFRKEIVEVNAVAVHSLNLDRRKAFSGCCHPEVN